MIVITTSQPSSSLSS